MNEEEHKQEEKKRAFHFEDIISGEELEEFRSKGYTVVDDFLGEKWAQSLYEACHKMQEGGDLLQHYFNFGDVKFEKPNVFEADLYDANLREKSMPLKELYEEATPKIVQALDMMLPELNLETGLKSVSVKLQHNNGGSFPYHYDNPGPPSKRQLTLIVYLNPSWKSGDGGELVLWPFLEKSISIAPKFDRAVMFRSDMLLHRVMPSHNDRYCFTIWVDGKGVNSAADTYLTKDHLRFESYHAAANFFRSSPLQRVISRALFAEEYEESLLQCVGGTPGEVPMLRHHRANVASIESKLGPLISGLRTIKK